MLGKNSPLGKTWETPTVGADFGVAAPIAPPVVKIATVVDALKRAAKEKGYDLSPELLSLMIGQLRGAEGAYPGVGGTLGGTNNMGASQVVQSLMTAKKGVKGWGAFAHKDSDPNEGEYIGWYWIAPSPLEAARHWFQDNWWGSALAKGNPTNATDYASILYRGRYFGGMHAGDAAHDPNSPAGKLNVADYASAIGRGVASASELAQAPDDPSKSTVNPVQFAQLAARQITEALFDKAKGGGIGSAWGYLLPPTWADLQKSNGVVWFGAAPSTTSWGSLAWGAAGAVGGGLLGLLAGPLGAVAGATAGATLLGGGHAIVTKAAAPAAPPDPKAAQTKLNALGMASPALKVDGQIGPLSIAAIKKFQAAKGLPVTGALDAATAKALGV